MDIAEDLVKYVIKYTLDHAKDEMEYLDKYVEEGLIDNPFPGKPVQRRQRSHCH